MFFFVPWRPAQNSSSKDTTVLRCCDHFKDKGETLRRIAGMTTYSSAHELQPKTIRNLGRFEGTFFSSIEQKKKQHRNIGNPTCEVQKNFGTVACIVHPYILLPIIINEDHGRSRHARADVNTQRQLIRCFILWMRASWSGSLSDIVATILYSSTMDRPPNHDFAFGETCPEIESLLWNRICLSKMRKIINQQEGKKETPKNRSTLKTATRSTGYKEYGGL
eukprot:scaffold2422_cov171-Amphora_coffeaeformis.AAC.9